MRMFAAAAAMAAAALSGPSTGVGGQEDAPLLAGPTPAPAPAVPPMIVRVPTLVIWGEKDTGTHWIAREKAPEVNALVREFLAQPAEPGKPPRQ